MRSSGILLKPVYLALCVILAVVSKRSIRKIDLFVTILKNAFSPLSLCLYQRKEKKILCCCLSFLVLTPLLCDYEISHDKFVLAAGN